MSRIGRHFMPNMSRAAWGFMQSGDFPVPVLHLKFGKNTGTVAYDSSPNKFDGTIDGASWVKGYLGPGLSFDNLDDYAYVDDDDILDKIVCFMASINPVEYIDSVTALHVAISKEAEYRGGIYLGYSTTPNSFSSQFYDGVDRSGASYTIPAYNKFYRVVAQFRNLKSELYVNGVLKSTGDVITSSGIDNNQPVRIGGGIANRYAKVIVDEILCYDEVLTPAQIRQDAQGYR